jgi:prolyl oligopeptidase
MNYPPTRKVDHTDEYHGMIVPDPYRWLEDADSADTQEWIKEQNTITSQLLESIPVRDEIRDRLKELWDFPKRWAPVQRGGRYFQLRNSGLQNQDVLFIMDAPMSEGRILLDPNALSNDGTVAMVKWEPSHDGQMLAYATSESGSDWRIWRVRDVDSGEDLADELKWSKFADIAWLKDGSGFYYARYDEPESGKDLTEQNYFQKVYFHKLGDAQAQDQLIYERPDEKEWGFDPKISDDDAYLILHVWHGTDIRNRLFYQELAPDAAMVELISDLEAAYRFLGNDGPVLYFRTTLDAPNGRIIAIDISNPEKAHWRTAVPESTDAIEEVKMVNDEFNVVYLHDAHHLIKRYDRAGSLVGSIDLPVIGSIPSLAYELNITGERTHKELFYSFWSFLYPPAVYRFAFEEGHSELLYEPSLDFEHDPFVTRQVFATSKDGTRIPMFLTHRKDLDFNGTNPTLLYGYGGFNIPLVPRFTVSHLAFAERGGVVAWANLRGGGEYGEEWHQAGMLDNKQNVFDDFIACADFLIQEKVTSPRQLAITGGSNGGLLVGACMNQRPDLFGAAVPVVGVMDMLRFHEFTIGWAWVSDYGSSQDPGQFKTLYAYSPLHNLQPGTKYPATMVVTSDHDDRVVPAHSFKYTAALQAAQGGKQPAIVRIQTKAGHGLGKPTDILIEEAADILAFIDKSLEMENIDD